MLTLHELIALVSRAISPDALSPDQKSILLSVASDLKQELAMCEFCARIGVQYSSDQTRNRSSVLSYAKNGVSVESVLHDLEKKVLPSDRDAELFYLVHPLVAFVLSSEQRANEFKNLSGFAKSMAKEVILASKGEKREKIKKHYGQFMGEERVGHQIDCFPNFMEVRRDADVATKLNEGFKKKETQRQLEKKAKAEATLEAAVEEVAREISEINWSDQDFKKNLKKALNALGCIIKSEDLTKSAGFDPSARPKNHSTHNLIVKGKRTDTVYMISMLQDEKIDLKEVAKTLNEKELRMVNVSTRDDLLCQTKGCFTLLSLYGNKTGLVKSVVMKSLFDESNEKDAKMLRICVGCTDPLDHSQHQIVDIKIGDIKKLLAESNTSKPIFI